MKPFNKINGYRLRPMKPIMSTPTTTINILDEDDEDEDGDDDEDEDEDGDNEDANEENALLFDEDNVTVNHNNNNNNKINRNNRSKKMMGRKKSLSLSSSSSDRRQVRLSSMSANNSLDDDDDESSLTIGKIKIIKPARRKQRVRLKLCSSCVSLIIVILCICLTVYLVYSKKLYLLGQLLIKTIGLFLPTSSLLTDSRLNRRQCCHQINVTQQWHQTFPMLTIESALRLVDVNQDGHLDPIIAYGTGADVAYYPPVVCQVYFNLTEEQSRQGCGGGLMALDGKTGHLIWNQYTRHELFAVNCELDVTGDKVKDCICGGRMASMYALNGATGEIIWSYLDYEGEPICSTSNFYTPLYISKDLDADGLPDLILMHGGDPLRSPHEKNHLVARLIIASSATGKVLNWVKVPDGGESYYSPQQLTRTDGNELIMFGTGGETHPGSLWVVPLDSLIHGNMHKAHAIYTDCCKGIMVPPVLIDINNDSIVDIVMSLFNSTVIAFDGLTFRILWRFTLSGSETYSSPAVGYFNDDRVPDFFVSYQFGPGFPIYYYSQANVLDGSTGKPLLSQPISMLVGTQSSPLTISTNGANDIFLFWLSTCDNVNQSVTNLEPFKMLPGTTVHQASRADFCSIRFNSTLYTQLIALTSNSSHVIYDSRLNKPLERSTLDYAAIGQQWLRDHQSDQDTDQDPYYNLAQSPYLPLSSSTQSPIAPSPSSLFDNVRPDMLDYQSAPYYRIKDKQIERDRFRRHVGVHDGEGVQRVISTGTLAPSDSPNSIDIIFTTYWAPATKGVNLVSKGMQKCMDRYLTPEKENKLRLGPKARLKGYDHDAYVEIIEETCAKSVGINLTKVKDDYDPYNRPMGGMTVYRKTIKCVNTTAMVRPYGEQMWPAYLGKHSNSLAIPIFLD